MQNVLAAESFQVHPSETTMSSCLDYSALCIYLSVCSLLSVKKVESSFKYLSQIMSLLWSGFLFHLQWTQISLQHSTRFCITYSPPISEQITFYSLSYSVGSRHINFSLFSHVSDTYSTGGSSSWPKGFYLRCLCGLVSHFLQVFAIFFCHLLSDAFPDHQI